MKTLNYLLVANGDSGITLLFDEPISENLSRQINSLADICQQRFVGQIEQIIPAYQSLTLHYQTAKLSGKNLSHELNSILKLPLPDNTYQSKTVTIPVCYEKQFAQDLQYVAKHTNMTQQQVIEKHSQTEYFVHMLGFSPGFLYLGGLDPQLACPRKASPDLSVPAGSIGIGGSQTGIYPQSSPGGWQIIGRTPLPMFDIKQTTPCVANALDLVIFKPISADEFAEISKNSL